MLRVSAHLNTHPKPNTIKKRSVGIVGTGNVGTSIATSIIHRNIVREIKLYDKNESLCSGETMDLQDEAFISGVRVHQASDLSELKKCELVVITAGAKQQPDEPRVNLIQRNVNIIKSIITELSPIHPDQKILLVSNPVDILTTLTQQLCPDVPRNHILGSGTYLDSQRLRVELSHELEVSVRSVHAYVIGEHGDSQVIAISSSSVGGKPLQDYINERELDINKISLAVRNKAYDIIKKKGATHHGIGACAAAITETILLDKKEVIPVSAYVPEYGVSMGWPAIVGNQGVRDIIGVHLSDEEQRKLTKSSRIIRDYVNSCM